MQFYKLFLIGFVHLFLSFNQQAGAMEDDQSEIFSTPMAMRLPDLPIEIQAYIFFFLDDQRDLLRVGVTSKEWRKAAEMVWKNKPLDLSRRRLNEADYKALANGPFSFLILKDVKLGKEETCILTRSSRFTHLDLSANSIGAEGAKAISVAHFPLLTTLDLSYNSIGDEGAKAIAAAHFPLLTILNLSYKEAFVGRGEILPSNSIGVEGVKAIADANFPLLSALHLSYNSIGDEGAKVIADANFPLLADLYLFGNNIGAEGKEALEKKKNPRLRIDY